MCRQSVNNSTWLTIAFIMWKYMWRKSFPSTRFSVRMAAKNHAKTQLSMCVSVCVCASGMYEPTNECLTQQPIETFCISLRERTTRIETKQVSHITIWRDVRCVAWTMKLIYLLRSEPILSYRKRNTATNFSCFRILSTIKTFSMYFSLKCLLIIFEI